MNYAVWRDFGYIFFKIYLGSTCAGSSVDGSIETLHNETKPKKESREQTEHKRKIKTRTVAKEEESSPLSVSEPKKKEEL